MHAALLDPDSVSYGHPDTSRVLPDESLSLAEYYAYQQSMRKFVRGGAEIAGKPVISWAWRKIVEAAERHDDPGRFTALIGYEYSLAPGARHLHRNVIFRGSEVPEWPFSARDSTNPADLWAWLDGLRARGIEAMGIPHNMNQSDGLAFMETTWKGEPIDADFAAARMRNEPVVEVTQKKGIIYLTPKEMLYFPH